MLRMYTEIYKCRICKNRNLLSVLNLGLQSFTGIFPKKINNNIPIGPLELVKCDNLNNNNCGLLQLKHSFDLNQLYGENYGYRSGLNPTMVKHLNNKVDNILKLVSINKGDLIVDIGSNDATLLKAYSNIRTNHLVGFDPTGKKFSKYYPKNIKLIPNFFSYELFKKNFGSKKAKIITSIAMFYDLEDPLQFMSDIKKCLDDDGIWVFEQSYMPTMIEECAYDTICHEHLEYYGFYQIKWMAEKIGLKIISVELNKVNGGSFSVIIKKGKNELNNNKFDYLIKNEKNLKLDSLLPYKNFEKRIFKHKHDLIELINKINNGSKNIFGYGASTKGNVILQYCNITKKDIPYIIEINPDKFGSYTPGTKIPIISYKEALKLKPDYLFVLPWHFRNYIIEKEKNFLKNHGKLIFPLPKIEIIDL